MAKKALEVTVRTRQNVVFKGEAEAVSSVNTVGPFDILAGHTNFVSMIRNMLTIHKLDGSRMDIVVENGVLVVENNIVQVFLGVTKI